MMSVTWYFLSEYSQWVFTVFFCCPLLLLAFANHFVNGRDFRVTERTAATSTAQPSEGRFNVSGISTKSTHPPFSEFVWLFSFSLKERWDWWMASTSVRVGWRCSPILVGGQCAMTLGTSLTHRLCVTKWAVERPWWLGGKPSSGPAQGQSYWTISSAPVQRRPCRSAPIYPGTYTTVTTLKMPVSRAHCPDLCWGKEVGAPTWDSCTLCK